MPKQLLQILKNGLLPLLLGCGLFFINIRDSHDWGDDFAQYLLEARNIEQGLPLDSSSYIQNPDFLLIGPKAYPPGFPTLLTISNSLFHNEIIGGQYLVSFFLLMMGWVFFLLLRKYKTPYLLSLLLMLSLIYHPWMLEQKVEILSDIPFAFFVLLTCLLADTKKGLWYFALAGIAAGIAITIRSVGWVLPLAGVVTLIYYLVINKRFDTKYTLFTATTILIAFGINTISGYNGFSGGYSSSIAEGADFLSTTYHHLQLYFYELQSFIEIEVNHWHGLMLFLQLLMWAGFIFGLVKFRKYPLIVVFLLGYLALILIFPFTGGFRFLLPVIPLILVLSATGFPGLSKLQSLVAIMLLLILNIAYQPYKQYIIHQQDKVVEGPQMPEAQELFNFIKINLNKDDVIVFSKSRALGYYTNVKTAATLWEIDQTEFIRQTERLGATHYLDYTGIEYFALNDFVRNNAGSLEILYQNEKFTLYKK